jgi:hypothetical protein
LAAALSHAKSPAMTRPAIERWIKLFVVALILTFTWTVAKVCMLIGLIG